MGRIFLLLFGGVSIKIQWLPLDERCKQNIFWAGKCPISHTTQLFSHVRLPQARAEFRNFFFSCFSHAWVNFSNCCLHSNISPIMNLAGILKPDFTTLPGASEVVVHLIKPRLGALSSQTFCFFSMSSGERATTSLATPMSSVDALFIQLQRDV